MPATAEVWLDTQQVNTTTTAGRFDPNIIQLADGRILVTWTDTSTGDLDVFGQIFDVLGNPVGGEFQVNTAFQIDDEGDSANAATTQGGWVSVYEDTNSQTDIRLQLYDDTGTSINNVSIAFDATDPAVAVSSSTSVLVSYVNSSGNIVGRIYNPVTETVGAEFTILSGGINTTPDVTVLSNGNYVVVAERTEIDSGSIVFNIFDSSGSQVTGASFLGDTNTNGDTDSTPSVTALSGGGFVVTWSNIDTNDTDIEFQVFDATGTSTSNVITVQGSGGATDNNNEARVEGLSDGGFVILFDDDEANTIALQRYDATGATVGAEVNLDVPGGTDPDIIVLEDGRIAAVWRAEGNNIQMQILDTRDAPNTNGDNQVGTIGADIVNESGANQNIFLHDGDDILIETGTSNANEVFDGGDGVDTIQANEISTNDVVIDLAAETYQAGGGNTQDLLNFENAIGAGGDDTITGDSGDNTLAGNDGNDTLNGGGGNDDLNGGDGNDRLVHDGNGAATLNGGSGDDELVINGVNIDGSVLDGGTGSDTFDISFFDFDGSDVDLSTGIWNDGFIDVLTLTNIENVIGTDGDDTITGDSGNNTLSGNDGNDIINGGGGDDVLNGGDGNDRLVHDGNGIDTLNGGAGDDVLVINGSLLAGSVLDGGTGLDTFDISFFDFDGSDVDLSTGIWNDGFRDVLTLTNIENVIGTDGDDTITGDSGNNTLSGNDGNDIINGGGGNDIINSGNGNDTVNSGDGVDMVNLGAGDDRLEITRFFDLDTGSSYEGGTGTDTVVLTGPDVFNIFDLDTFNLGAGEFTSTFGGRQIGLTGFENFDGSASDDSFIIVGTSGVNILIGSSGTNQIDGGAGDDTINGLGGDDILIGGLGADVLDGGDGIDTADYSGSAGGVIIFAGGREGRDVASGTAGDGAGDVLSNVENFIGSDFGDQFRLDAATADVNIVNAGLGDDRIRNLDGSSGDVLNGEGGDDNIFGGAGAETLNGGDGEDNLFGNQGDDTLDGGADRDVIFGGSGDDMIFGGTGLDRLDGNSGNDTIFGGDDRDNINGGSGADTLFGESGDDIIDGGNGSGDILDGGIGNDRLTGGIGNDTFIFADGYEVDRITDFNNGAGDVVDISDFGIADFAALQALMIQTANDVRIDFGDGDVLIFNGLTMADLDANDFIF